MSVWSTSQVRLWLKCDHAGCDAEFRPAAAVAVGNGPGEHIDRVRARAWRQGWTIDAGRVGTEHEGRGPVDYCPQHVPHGPPPKGAPPR